MRLPTISLEEQPTTKRLPGLRLVCSNSSVTTVQAWEVISRYIISPPFYSMVISYIRLAINKEPNYLNNIWSDVRYCLCTLQFLPFFDIQLCPCLQILSCNSSLYHLFYCIFTQILALANILMLLYQII